MSQVCNNDDFINGLVVIDERGAADRNGKKKDWKDGGAAGIYTSGEERATRVEG